MSALSPSESQELEHEYARHREEILGFLARSFRQVPDHEELYQEAWTELLELRAQGRAVGDLRRVLRTIAWRRARDHVRDEHSDPVDPSSVLFRSDSAQVVWPDEEAQIHLDAAIARQIVDSLDDRHAAVIKLRFEAHLGTHEIQERLGVSAKRLEKIVTEAYHLIEEQLLADETGATTYRRRQRSLLLACLLGRASARQVARARRMVEEDPGCRALLRELHFTMDRVAALLPVPVLLDRTVEQGPTIIDRLGHAFSSVKHTTGAAFGRGDLAASGEQAARGAAALGAGAATKAAIVCFAIGATAVCLTGNGIRVQQHARGHAPVHHKQATRPHHSSAPRVIAQAQQPVAVHHVTAPAPRQEGSPSATAPPAPSPAPPGSTEFGPGDVGSQPASTTPAAAPTGGGGEFLP